MSNGNLPVNLEGGFKWSYSQALPVYVGLVGERNASAAFGKKTELGQAITGLIGFGVGYSMIGSNLGTMGKNFGAGVAVGGVVDITNSALQRYADTSVEEILTGLFSPPQNGNGA